MCNNGFFGGGNCCWIIILILLFCFCGNGWGSNFSRYLRFHDEPWLFSLSDDQRNVKINDYRS